jgi:hypothetical protein
LLIDGSGILDYAKTGKVPKGARFSELFCSSLGWRAETSTPDNTFLQDWAVCTQQFALYAFIKFTTFIQRN